MKESKQGRLKYKIGLTLVMSFLLMNVGFAQNSDTKYNVPLKETIHKIEEIFKVKVKDEHHLLEDKNLDYGNWRIRQGNLEISLTNVLAPFDLTFFKKSDSLYTVRKFEYSRRSNEVGEEKLAFLRHLYTTKSAWEKRKENLKSCMEEALWLDKAPSAPQKKPILTPKRVHTDYSVQNIGLEILPGVYATGSICRPYPLKGKHPVIICPNGHFYQGRYRKSEQIRAASLAKMGALVITFDLFSWGESALQFPYKYHRNSITGTIQVLDEERLLDYVLTLPEADKSRVGVTGGSGGGSHTLFLIALDDRIKVSVPVVMVSSHFSGGCPGESGQPIHLCGNGTNNAEIAAMAAPRPQLIISDGQDWTNTVPELEFPFIQRTYEFYGKKKLVKNAHFLTEGHNYEISKRKAMYPFMAKYLGLNLGKIQNKKGEIEESGIVIEDKNTMKVFGENGEKLPKDALKDIDKLYALFGEKNHKQQ